MAARAIAADHGLRFEVIVGEEITTRGGHLLGLFLDRAGPAAALASRDDRPRSTTRAASRSPPIRCSRSRCARPAGRSAASSTTPIRATAPTRSRRSIPRPSAGRTGASWRSREELGLAAVGNSDAHAAERRSARAHTTFPGHDADGAAGRDPRPARRTGTGRSTAIAPQLATFGRQLRKYSRDARRELRGRVLRTGTGRDHGYPGGRSAAAGVRPRRRRGARRRWPTSAAAGEASRASDEDRPRQPVRLPAAGRRDAARPAPLREPAPPRPRRPDHHAAATASSAPRRAT